MRSIEMDPQLATRQLIQRYRTPSFRAPSSISTKAYYKNTVAVRPLD